MSQMERDRDRVALVFNGFLAPNATVELVARRLGMHRLFMENGFFPGTVQADVRGINGLSSLPREPDFYDTLSADDLGDAWPAVFEVREPKLGRDNSEDSLPEDFIFVPFQVPSDMQILALSPWIKDMHHLHKEIARLACR
jgi:capsular polysaccharide export protein